MGSAAEKLDIQKLMVGTGTPSLSETIYLTKFAANHGYKVALVLPPFYYKNPKDEGLFAYFSEIIQKVANEKLKIQIYHFPAVSQIPISHKLIEMLLICFFSQPF